MRAVDCGVGQTDQLRPFDGPVEHLLGENADARLLERFIKPPHPLDRIASSPQYQPITRVNEPQDHRGVDHVFVPGAAGGFADG